MDQGPEVITTPEPGASRPSGHRLGLGALVIAVAVATLVIPKVVAPGPKSRPAVAAPIPPMAQMVAAPSASASAPAAHLPAAKPCGRPGATACAIYTGALGGGWSIVGTGLTATPGKSAPGDQQPAVLVKRSQPPLAATALALTDQRPVVIGAGTRLSLRVWGGSRYGTVLKVSAAPAGTGSTTLSAPAGRWTAYTIKLSQVTSSSFLTRIDLVAVSGVVPTVADFYLDDIALAG